MTAPELSARLREFDACEASLAWVQGMDLATAWASCERADWMSWLLRRSRGLDELTTAKLACRLVEQLPFHVLTPALATSLATLRAFVAGEATQQAVAEAWQVARPGQPELLDNDSFFYAAHALNFAVGCCSTVRLLHSPFLYEAKPDSPARVRLIYALNAGSYAAACIATENCVDFTTRDELLKKAQAQQAPLIRELVPVELVQAALA